MLTSFSSYSRKSNIVLNLIFFHTYSWQNKIRRSLGYYSLRHPNSKCELQSRTRQRKNQLFIFPWVPPSSTRRFHTRTKLFQHPKSISSTPKSLNSTSKTPQFHTALSSTPKPLSSTHPSVPHCLYRAIFCLRGVSN